MNWKKRSGKLELLDLDPLPCSREEYHDCLKRLGDVGRWLGGNRLTMKAFSSLKQRPDSILDVGCGGGWFTAKLAATYPTSKVVGIDLNEEAVAVARSHHTSFSNLYFQTDDLRDLSSKFDVITSTLVCHHLKDEELVDFIKTARKRAVQAIILNDLHRSRIAYLGFAVIAPLLFRNRLISNDGLISIQRGFRRADWKRLLEKAGVPEESATISWHFPFRWVVRIEC